MTKTLLTELPNWPRYLSRHEAARYSGVSVDVFDNEVRAGASAGHVVRLSSATPSAKKRVSKRN